MIKVREAGVKEEDRGSFQVFISLCECHHDDPTLWNGSLVHALGKADHPDRVP
jgi:hypothetical protein